MSPLTYKSFKTPFGRWMGPFSPARGIKSGFRFHQKRLGTWVETDSGSAFWRLAQSAGAERIADVVLNHWGGGRVLLLPNGLVIKPLQDDEVGRRALIGLFEGPIVLETPSGKRFNLNSPGPLEPGDPWPGPKTTGLECAIQADGSLIASWSHPTPYGSSQTRVPLRAKDQALAAGFKKARPGETGGRVRLTANGHVITNRKVGSVWRTLYVGHIAGNSLLGDWKHWIRGGS
jgi:hypothetical protein